MKRQPTGEEDMVLDTLDAGSWYLPLRNTLRILELVSQINEASRLAKLT